LPAEEIDVGVVDVEVDLAAVCIAGFAACVEHDLTAVEGKQRPVELAVLFVDSLESEANGDVPCGGRTHIWHANHRHDGLMHGAPLNGW